jgi:flagellar hook-associated protein 1 FlgK
MSSLISGIQTALQAVLAHQQSIEVIEHNVANANTPGYHRQEAVLSAGIPTGFSNMAGFYAGEMGSGVTVDRIKRYGMEFFDNRYRGMVSDAKRWALESQGLKQVEATLAETGTNGLVAKMDAFYAGWQSLSVDPTNTALRADVLQRSKDLAGAIQERNAQLNRIRIDQNLEINQRGDEVNQIADQIARLNLQITHVLGTNQQPNDMMDQRDQLLDRLSELTGARSDLQASGMVNVSIAGHNLVDGGSTFKLNVNRTALGTTITWADGDTFTPATGELAGLFDLRDNVIPKYQGNLDQLAYNLITETNKIHNPTVPGSNPPYNDPGLNFFNSVASATGAAGLIAVNPAMDTLSNIMGASSAAYPEDGTIARNIAALQGTAIAGLGGVTMNEYYTQKAAELGLFTQKAEGYSRDRSLIAKALSDQRESLEGVSLDEEAANMVKAQKAFQAATRMVNAIDEMLDRVINNMGLVGR